MTDPAAPDPQALARQFLDLWPEQAGLLAADPKLAELSATWLTLWQRGAEAAPAAARQAGTARTVRPSAQSHAPGGGRHPAEHNPPARGNTAGGPHASGGPGARHTTR